LELEHGAIDPVTNVTGDDPLLTGKIAAAHLKEIKDCHTRLNQLEAEAEAQIDMTGTSHCTQKASIKVI
jgi:hypothetical protein